MKTATLFATAVLASAVLVTPTLAQTIVRQTIVTETVDLNQFVGQNLFGAGHANLGSISQVDPKTGVIALSGRYGEYALISTSLVIPDGPNLRAPTLTQGDIKIASEMNLAHPGATMTSPNIIIVEPPLG